MVMTLTPDMEARLADLAHRLGMDGPDAPEQALIMAVAELEAKVSPPRRKLSPEEVAAEMAPIVAAARRWREEHPFDDDNPPSRVWQEELYDDRGLPR